METNETTATIKAVSQQNTLVSVWCGDYSIALVEYEHEDHGDMNILALNGEIVESCSIKDGMLVFILANKGSIKEKEVAGMILAQNFALAIEYATR